MVMEAVKPDRKIYSLTMDYGVAATTTWRSIAIGRYTRSQTWAGLEWAIRRSHLPPMVLHAIWSGARTWFPTAIVGGGGGRDCEMEQKIGRAIGLVGEDAAYSTGLPSGRRHIPAESPPLSH